MYLKAFAKINLYLDVVNKKDDGFHDLDMVMLPLELHDSIAFNILPYAPDSYVTCDHVSLADGNYNVINKTIKFAKEKYGFKENFSVSIHKEIPIKSGLGGGSADVAAVLKAIYKSLKIEDTEEEMIDLARTIGSDVPFCFKNVSAHVSGVGDKIEPIKPHHGYFVLIVMPSEGLSTKVVFKECDNDTMKHGDINAVIDALKTGDDEKLAANMFNGLEETAFRLNPEIKQIKDMLIKDGLKMVLMSGSGSSVYALSRNYHQLQALAKKYDKLNYDVYLTRTI